MKLSTEQQIARIKQITASEHVTTCTKCKLSYVPMNEFTERLCPVCDKKQIVTLKALVKSVEGIE